MNFSSLAGNNRFLYNAVWGQSTFPDLDKEMLLGKNTGLQKDGSLTLTRSPSSVTLNVSPTTVSQQPDRLISLFGIAEPELFRQKYDQAVSGDGDEAKKIMTAHSSSLCALLFFYNVTENNPLVLELGGRLYRFNKSLFEVKNKVTERGKPSNMDVVLTGRAVDSDRDAVLFLESKFSEYYTGTKNTLAISRRYKEDSIGSDLYVTRRAMSKAGLNDSDLFVFTGEEFAVTYPEKTYIDGIKQMISHYIGVRKWVDRSLQSGTMTVESRWDIVSLDPAKTDVFLSQIVFDRGIKDLRIKLQAAARKRCRGDTARCDTCPVGCPKCLDDYSTRYTLLADVLNQREASQPHPFVIGAELICYSQFPFDSHSVENKIKQYYSL